MNKVNVNYIDGELFVECPHCMVCSTKLSAKEKTLVDAGQQMVVVCQVCGAEVVLNG